MSHMSDSSRFTTFHIAKPILILLILIIDIRNIKVVILALCRPFAC